MNASTYIKVDERVKETLAKVFNVTTKFVYMALTNRRDSRTARKIRYVAVRDYVGVPMVHCPACDTLHEVTENGRAVMRQEFANGAVLVWYKGTPEVVVNFKGKEERRFECDTLARLSDIPLYAESL